MDEFRKHQLKEQIKKKKVWLIGTGCFLLAGIIAWIIGSYLSGADPIQWLTNPFAITVYILVAIFLIVAGLALFGYFMNKEGK